MLFNHGSVESRRLALARAPKGGLGGNAGEDVTGKGPEGGHDDFGDTPDKLAAMFDLAEISCRTVSVRVERLKNIQMEHSREYLKGREDALIHAKDDLKDSVERCEAEMELCEVKAMITDEIMNQDMSEDDSEKKLIIGQNSSYIKKDVDSMQDDDENMSLQNNAEISYKIQDDLLVSRKNKASDDNVTNYDADHDTTMANEEEKLEQVLHKLSNISDDINQPITKANLPTLDKEKYNSLDNLVTNDSPENERFSNYSSNFQSRLALGFTHQDQREKVDENVEKSTYLITNLVEDTDSTVTKVLKKEQVGEGQGQEQMEDGGDKETAVSRLSYNNILDQDPNLTEGMDFSVQPQLKTEDNKPAEITPKPVKVETGEDTEASNPWESGPDASERRNIVQRSSGNTVEGEEEEEEYHNGNRSVIIRSSEENLGNLADLGDKKNSPSG